MFQGHENPMIGSEWESLHGRSTIHLVGEPAPKIYYSPRQTNSAWLGTGSFL